MQISNRMKKLTSHENLFIVANIREIMEQADIACMIKNEFAGSGSGEIPHFETWPELWVINEEDFDKAQAILTQIEDNSWHNEWTCNFCQEKNADSFEYCWNCRNDREIVDQSVLKRD